MSRWTVGKRAFVTGAGGQDGSYLCELLLSLSEYDQVVGMIRPSGDGRKDRLARCIVNPRFTLVYGDITDATFGSKLANASYDEIYLLAAQTQVMQSYYAPTVAFETNALATARILDAISPITRVYFAATSEMFGTIPEGQSATESFPLAGQSPYAAAKVASHLLCRVYRERGYYVSSGISFNHESCRRGSEFVTRKIGLGVRQFLRTGKPVVLGNVDSRRDWHHASDTVRGMWMSLQADKPSEYVFATGTTHSVMDLAIEVCGRFDVVPSSAIKVADSEKRPWDVTYLCGDAIKAEIELGWTPHVTWSQLVDDICKPEGEL